jgi:hypothetical protein
MKAFDRIVGSTRFWTAFIGLITVVAAQLGMSQDKANALSAAVLGLVTVLISSYTVRSLPAKSTSASPAATPDTLQVVPV